jgi:glycosyltransferase involved in cell wall biosynthesis
MQPAPAERNLSRLTDLVLRRRLSRATGTVVTTRPALHLAAKLWCPPTTRLIGQDHKNFATRFANQRQAALLRHVVPGLDAYVVLTQADADDYQRELSDDSVPHVRVIRNALPWPVAARPAPLRSKIVVAAGRLAREKGFDRLLAAFADIAPDHPDWQLHIHGEGAQRAALTRQIRSLDLVGQVRLCGYTADLYDVLSQASVFAMSSRAEGFPMVLIEAMSVGLPAVAFDCPRGPGEIIDSGRTGFLVRDGDVAGLTHGLRRLVENEELRRRCGQTALLEAQRYSSHVILAEWLKLLEDVDQ